MKKSYANIDDVLPPELAEKVREHYTGALWIPDKPRAIRDARKRLIMTLHQQGSSTAEIGKLAKISERRVRQILQQEEETLEAISGSSPESRMQGQS